MPSIGLLALEGGLQGKPWKGPFIEHTERE